MATSADQSPSAGFSPESTRVGAPGCAATRLDQGPQHDAYTGADTVAPDFAVPDQRVQDAGVDKLVVDTKVLPDKQQPDQDPPDAALPDAAQPDQLLPDTALPDLQLPDAPVPDTFVPDLSKTQWLFNKLTWITVPAGSFMKGRPLTAVCPAGTGATNTYVKKFEIMKYEMTKNLRSWLTTPQPWSACTDGWKCPASKITWNNAARACNQLNVIKGYKPCYYCTAFSCSPVKDLTKCGYRLPTAVEYEKAYRARTTTEYYNGAASSTQCTGWTKANAISWYKWNSGGKPHEVGTKTANTWGLHDLGGNVAEWLHDSCSGGHLAGGGSYGSWSTGVQAATAICTKTSSSDTYASNRSGFRCVRSL